MWHMQISFSHNVAVNSKASNTLLNKKRWMKLEERINIIIVGDQLQPFTGAWIVEYYSLVSLGKIYINT